MLRNKRAGARLPRPAPPADPFAACLRLRSVGAAVTPAAALERPLLMNLVLEDACWEFGRLALAAQRPRWWHLRRRSQWRRDRRRLVAKRQRLVQAADPDALRGGTPITSAD